jgi:hypothetical protein
MVWMLYGFLKDGDQGMVAEELVHQVALAFPKVWLLYGFLEVEEQGMVAVEWVSQAALAFREVEV